MAGQQQGAPGGAKDQVERLKRDAQTEAKLADAEDLNAEADLYLARAEEGVGQIDKARELREQAATLHTDSAGHKRRAADDLREVAKIINGQEK